MVHESAIMVIEFAVEVLDQLKVQSRRGLLSVY